MCFTKKSWIPRFAWHSIPVQKILYTDLNKNWITPFQQHIAPPGTVITCAKPFIYGLFKKSIEAEGVHSYYNLSPKELCRKGFVYTKPVKAEIPRFSWYWVGNKGEIASSKLKIIGF